MERDPGFCVVWLVVGTTSIRSDSCNPDWGHGHDANGTWFRVTATPWLLRLAVSSSMFYGLQSSYSLAAFGHDTYRTTAIPTTPTH